jgi:predicted dehydrogenase
MSQQDGVSRREFVKTSAIAAGGLAALGGVGEAISVARGAHAWGSDTIKVGLIGCGGRGTGAAMNAMMADAGAVLWSLGDVFADRVESCHKALADQLAEHDTNKPPASGRWSDRMNVAPERRFSGFDAYQKVLESGVDVVCLCTSPGFRPVHLAAAVAAGKHIFCEKPVATDATGLRSVVESVAKQRQASKALMSGFCWRHSEPEVAAYNQVLDGGLGDVRAIYTTYNAGGFPGPHTRKPEWSDTEMQIRNWHYFSYLSGDHIVEQAVHAIDWIAWVMHDTPPVRCTAVGGRQSRPDRPEAGNIYDHFGVTYEYKSGVRAFHMCRHFPNTTFDNTSLVMGSTGNLKVNGWAPSHVIDGQKPWKYEGPHGDMYQNEHDELFRSIRSGTPFNDGERMANSTMMAIMGRMAAYTGIDLTWDQAINSKENIWPSVWEFGSMPQPPVARPGYTKLT